MNLGTIEKIGRKEDLWGTSYTKTVIGSYDRQRHITIDDAYHLLDSQPHLNRDKVKSAINQGRIYIYEFKGQKCIDRLDLGRVYHTPREEKQGITIDRYFSHEGEDPFNSVQ